MQMNEQTQGTVKATLEVLAMHCHEMARSKGFWADRYGAYRDGIKCDVWDRETGEKTNIFDVLKILNDRNDSELLMLIVSELAEACEGLRHGNGPSDHIPEYSCLEEELADAIIRILDMAAARNCRIGEAVIAKMAFNDTRPNKHGKAF